MVIPVPLIRRNIILRKLQQARAFTPGTAVTLREAGGTQPVRVPADHGTDGPPRMDPANRRRKVLPGLTA